MTSAFQNFEITDDDDSAPPDYFNEPAPAVDSPFTVMVDTREQTPYTFSNIYGDYRNANTPINVLTVRKMLPVADYSIVGYRGIAVERKSKEDIFGSLANSQKRENFLERLRKMQVTLEYGAVVVECTQKELLESPPDFTNLNPKAVYHTAISWELQFPAIHWTWLPDRASAEEHVYRLFEKYYQHKVDGRYKHHNKPIEQHLEAFRAGQIARMWMTEYEIPYPLENPLRSSWLRGWGFASSHLKGGANGTLYELGQTPKQESAKPAKKGKKEEQIKPLPGQTSFLDSDPNTELKEAIGSIYNKGIAAKAKKK
jgi:ERCC4-type nuclease